MDTSQRLAPIPTPRGVFWRELRIRVLPYLTFGIGLIIAVWLWHDLAPGTKIIGVAEGVRSLMTSPRSGTIEQLHVEAFQWVDQGAPIVTFLPSDPNVPLDLLQADLQLGRLLMEPSIADRNALNFEQIRVQSLRLRQELAAAKVNLDRAESALRRNQTLVEERLVSRELYEISVRDRDFYQVEIAEKTKALQEIDARLSELRAIGEPPLAGSASPFADLISRLRARLTAAETNWNPMTLRAPISGVVQWIYRQPRESLVEGEPLVAINSPTSDRIVAYLREPYYFVPRAGMEVEVWARNGRRERFRTRVTQVGAQFEAITNGLALLRTGALVDMGLPIVVALPAKNNLRPGELVDLALMTGTGPQDETSPRP